MHMHNRVMRGRIGLALPSTWLKRCCRAETDPVTSDKVRQQRRTEVDPFTTNQYLLVFLRIDYVIVVVFLPSALSLPGFIAWWRMALEEGWVETYECRPYAHKGKDVDHMQQSDILYTEALCSYFRIS